MAEDGSMTLTGHLKELRNRLIICAVVFVVGVVVSLAYADRLIDLLTAMGRDYYEFVSIAPQEKLMQYFRVSILAGVVVTVPVAFYHIYAFARPGLKRSESTFFKLVMLLGLILFCVGVLFAYKLMMPFMLRFLSTGIEGAEYIQTTTSIESYVNLCLTMFIIFGCVFEMPLITIILSKMGIINPQLLKQVRGVAIVIIFFIAAVVTPPDIVSQCMVAGPMVLLYFISILLSGIFYKPKEDDDDEEDDEDDEEAYDDDDLEEMNPKMDKAITIMGIAAGVIIVALIIFILVSFFGDFKFGGSSNKANTETSETQTDGIEVPDLKGLTFDEAKEQLNAKGLGIKNAGTVASDQYDEGQIVSQTPDALTKAEANTTVEVTLSSGKGEVSVPSVTGMDETTAYNTLTNSGFTPVKDYAYSADVAQGNVIEQSPNAGSLAKAGDNVKIVISRGKEQAETTSVAVPGVTGLTEDAARSAIQNAGLAVGNVSSAYSDSVASGQIISQSPVADTAVDAGTAVDFVVSMGAEPAQEVKPTTYKINLNIKKPNNESVAAANIYLYDGADGTGNILEQWTNQSISLFGEEGLSISKSGMLASSGSLKIDWLGADGQQLGSSQIVSPISFKAE